MKNSSRCLFALLAVLLFALAGCAAQAAPALAVTGDCAGYHLTAGSTLAQAVQRAQPKAQAFDVLLIGSSGEAVRISGEDMNGCTLAFSGENGWALKAKRHPPQASLSHLAMAVIVSAEGDAQAVTGILNEKETSTQNGRSVTNYTVRMVSSTAAEALHLLEQGERVMILELDGLGWEMLQNAPAPYLQSLAPERALVHFPPISPVNLASMLTGSSPAEHGILGREQRQLACEDIFAAAARMGKACAYIDGSHALVNTRLAPVLSLSDKAVFANAQKAMADAPDLLFVHFHEIDETAHAYGPYAPQTMQKISELEGYVQALAESFGGRVIITADHGLHAADTGGAHGVFSAEDMIVPYICTMGGAQ